MNAFARAYPAAWILLLAACESSVWEVPKDDLGVGGGVGTGGAQMTGSAGGGAGGAGSDCRDSANGAPCDDGDSCTIGDACTSDSCVGTALTCDAGADPTCLDATTLRTFAGACSAGECSYAPSDAQCPGACVDGACAQPDTWTDIGTIGGPQSSQWFGAVWTGSKMIVWGGTGPAGYLDTGGAYDPATDAWEAITTEGAPSARILVDAVWTGSEMIVWGGAEPGDQFVNSGGRYQPVTDTWSTTSTSGAPSPRFRNTSVWSGREMIVWGGMTTPEWTRLNSGGRYHPATDTWIPVTANGAPAARDDHTAIWTGTEVIVWGGFVDIGGGTYATNTGARYNPATDTWSPMSSEGAPAGRVDHEAIWTGAEMIVWGGYGTGSPGDLDSGGRYNPATDSWAPLSTAGAPAARRDHAAVWTGSAIIVWGGDAHPYDGTAFEEGAQYDPTSDTWKPLSLSGAPVLAVPHHAAVWTGSEMIVWGREAGSASFAGSRYLP